MPVSASNETIEPVPVAVTPSVPKTKPVATSTPSLSSSDLRGLASSTAAKYGLDPVLVQKIIGCESQWKATNVHPNVRAGTTTPWSYDIGLLQINDYYHETEWEAQGLDMKNPKDNLEFGLKMMQQQGTQPWNASKNCWLKGDTSAGYN